MLAVISPAKNLDFHSKTPTLHQTDCHFIQQASEIIAVLKCLAPAEIASLMKLSDKLSQLNFERYQAWHHPFDEFARAAVFAFNGDVYTGLDAYSLLQETQYQYLAQHVAILSGLYGVLNPFDAILPYRLEMGTKLAVSGCSNLYGFWKDVIAPYLNQCLSQHEEGILVNLASNEYFKAVDLSCLNYPVVTPVFKDYKNGQLKIISFFAKKARGMMVRYMVDHQIDSVEGLKAFNYGDYAFAPELSNATEWVFIR